MKTKTISCGTATIRSSEQYGTEVLLVKPRAKHDLWGFPKGHVNVNENHEDAAVRETFEETGVNTQILPHVLGSVKVKLKNEDKTVIIYMAIPVDPNQEPFPLDGENAIAAWHSIDQLPNAMESQKDLFAALRSTVTRLFPKNDAS